MPNDYPQPAIYLQSGSPATENRPADGYSGGELGSRFTMVDKADSDRAKGWQLVQLDSTMDVAPSAGAVAYWRNRTGYIVTTDVSVAGRGNPAGVFPNAPTYDYICCVQQQGRALVQLQTSPTAVPDDTGKIVIPSATDAKADVLAAGTAASYPALGVSVGASVSGQPFAVDLQLDGRP